MPCWLDGKRGHLARFSCGRDAHAPVAQPHPLFITPSVAVVQAGRCRERMPTIAGRAAVYLRGTGPVLERTMR